MTLAMPSGVSHSAGPMKYLRRPDRAGAQDYFAFGAGLEDLAIPGEQNACGAAILDDETIDQDVLLKAQIGAAQCGLEETARRRPAAPASLGDVEIADAFVVGGVEGRSFANSHLLGRFADGVENGPRQPRCLDAPAAAGAMMFALAQEVILQPAEGRQDIAIAPAGQAELTPVVIVGGLSAHRDHGVDRRGAA